MNKCKKCETIDILKFDFYKENINYFNLLKSEFLIKIDKIFEEFITEIQKNKSYNYFLNKDIDLLELSLRTTNVLIGSNICRISDLIEKDKIFVKKIHGMDREGFNEIIKSLDSLGLHLGMKIE